MRRLFLILLIALCFSWNTAKAQGFDAVPRKSQQNWAFPNCKTPEKAVLFTKTFTVTATRDSLSLTEKPPKEAPPEKAKECAKPAKLFPKESLRLFSYIDRIDQYCTLSVKNDCARTGFKMADENRNGSLTPAELQKAVTGALFLAELSANKTLDAAAIKAVVARGKKDGAKIAQDLFDSYDADKSKTLDYNELMTDKPLPAQPVIREMLEKSGKLIPAFALASGFMTKSK